MAIKDEQQGLPLEANMYDVQNVVPNNSLVPTVEQKKAWANQKYTNPTLISSSLEQTAANVEKDNPQYAELLRMAADANKQQEGVEESEKRYRIAQREQARLQHEKEMAAINEYRTKEYDNQNPSFAHSMMDEPFVQNTVGKRVYNPYTGRMEWRYPRTAGEWTGTLGTSALNMIYGGLAGFAGYPFAGYQLVNNNRKIQENNFYEPYELDKKVMENYVLGNGPEVPLTASEKLATKLGGEQLGALNENYADLDKYRFIKEKFGEDNANTWLKSQVLGAKNDDTAAVDSLVPGAMTISDLDSPEDIDEKIKILTLKRAKTKDPAMAKAIDEAIESHKYKRNKLAGTLPKTELSREQKESVDDMLYNMAADEKITDEEYQKAMQNEVIANEVARIEKEAMSVPESQRGAELQRLYEDSEVLNAMTQGWGDAGWWTIPSAIGGAVGAYFGGPIGATIGVPAGAALGQGYARFGNWWHDKFGWGRLESNKAGKRHLLNEAFRTRSAERIMGRAVERADAKAQQAGQPQATEQQVMNELAMMADEEKQRANKFNYDNVNTSDFIHA